MTYLKNKMKPAGKDDKFSVNVVDMQQIFDNEKEKKDKKPKLLISSSTQRNSILSTEIEKGVSIKAYNGGNRQKENEEITKE